MAHAVVARANVLEVVNLETKRMPTPLPFERLPPTLSKDADPDIPILKEAKAEYAKLQ